MPFKKTISSLLYNAGLEYDTGKFLSTIIMLGIGFGIAVFLTMYNASIELAVSIGAAALVLFEAIVFITLMLSASRRTYLMENSLPDFLILMSSNIRAGFTPDRALFASMRKEFGPLTKEINKAAKAAMTGKAFHEAFQVIGAKIESNILKRSIALIVEGVKAGGNLTDLLDDTSSDIRKFEQLKKEVDSNVSIYKIFLFAACAIGAPLLYATATFLIQIVFGIRSNIDFSAAEAASIGLPILKGTAISPDLVFWFSLVAITFTTLFSSLAVGIITAGREGEGIKYFPVLFGVAIIVFLGTGAGLKFIYSILFMPTG